MNQTIRQKQAVLQVLRDRMTLSTAELYQKIGLPAPARPPRFTVVPMGKNTFDIIDRTTGTSRGARAGHANACSFAKDLEHTAELLSSARATGRQFLSMVLRWTIVTACVLAVFAFYGARP
ncbi:hypothetical protein [Pseudomonas asplenii]|uniref:Uncharacterized protein n=1 Tax=Pseudomonas asplenii TaxID=53407 RepID=A0A1H6NSW5_9PSED|nr:hypothetical protein [Pseudomonas fuscovaginae]SEI17062.1 hypothetical protein SAMN05216581_3298 [Pseudomonas fuscovaginae]